MVGGAIFFMDFGVVGLDGLVGSDTGLASLGSVSDPETKQKWYGSGGFLKQERSGATEDDWKSLKIAKTDDFSPSKAMLLPHRNTLLRSNATLFSDAGQQEQQQQMLSFSSPKSEPLFMERSSQNALFPYYHQSHTSSAYNRNTGIYYYHQFRPLNLWGTLHFEGMKVMCLWFSFGEPNISVCNFSHGSWVLVHVCFSEVGGD